MAKIPYRFIPLPEEFLADDFIDDPDMMRLIRWIMKRISPEHTSIPLKKQKRNLELEPFEFMFGRDSCSLETGVSTKKIQVRMNQLVGLGFLVKVESKTVSTFTVFSLASGKKAVSKMVSTLPESGKKAVSKMVSTLPAHTPSREDINKNNGQQNGQHHGQHVGQQVGHNLEEEKIRSKEKDHHPDPSSKVVASDDGLDDDSFKEFKFLVNNKEKIVKIPISDLNECIAIKGSEKLALEAIEHILRSPGRKYEIYNWPNALATWNIKSTVKPRAAENEAHAMRLEALHANNSGWRCQVYRDTVKDQKGILFYNTCSQGIANNVFVSFVDPEYKEKTFKLLRDKRMLKALIPKP
jgi:hypothetical protein